MAIQRQFGLTLVELMVALVLTSTLMLGVGAAYQAISQTVTEVKALENAQEVLRSSQLVLSRSIRSATDVNIVMPVELQVQRANVHGAEIDCLGRIQPTSFAETFRFQNGELLCQVDDEGWVTLLTGVAAFDFSRPVDDLVRVRVAPEGLPEHFPQADVAATGQLQPYIRLDFAMKTRILVRET